MRSSELCAVPRKAASAQLRLYVVPDILDPHLHCPTTTLSPSFTRKHGEMCAARFLWRFSKLRRRRNGGQRQEREIIQPTAKTRALCCGCTSADGSTPRAEPSNDQPSWNAPLVLANVMKVVAADDDGALHLGGADGACAKRAVIGFTSSEPGDVPFQDSSRNTFSALTAQNTAADGHVPRERALLVDVSA